MQTILRHANIAATLAHYIIPDSAEVQAAMKRLGKVVGTVGKKGP